MGAIVGVSHGQLRRLFAAAGYRPPLQCLVDLRLETAAVLLADPALRIKEVTASVGWSDGSHFCRDFRRRYGVSPSEYRAARVAARVAALDEARSRPGHDAIRAGRQS
jgi:two-component system response regulator YesN